MLRQISAPAHEYPPGRASTRKIRSQIRAHEASDWREARAGLALIVPRLKPGEINQP